jgi:hypothetical protein
MRRDSTITVTPCCRMAVIRDPAGNKIIIHKFEPENEKGTGK